MTNHGPVVSELESELKKFLGAKHVFFVANGTLALQLAIKALDLHGEVITTPFSYVATTSSLVWEGCKPVFVDIDSQSLTIDPKKIETAITPHTTAILATHVYGNPCDVSKIELIAKKHCLKVVYDAAHAFGVSYRGKALANFGDISILSFHATKVFHTIEGGALVTNSDKLARKISYLRNFGHDGQEKFYGLGINGKNSEVHAAMGLCILPRFSRLIKKREAVSAVYDKFLLGMPGVRRPKIREGTKYNFSYYPILLPSEKVLLKFKTALNKENIFPRRYFYPSLDTLNYIKSDSMAVSNNIARRVLCLPLYPDLPARSVTRICKILKSVVEPKRA